MSHEDNILALILQKTGMRKNPAELANTFDAIPIEKRKETIKGLNIAMCEMLEESPDPNDLLAAMLDEERLKELTSYPAVYECAYQMPFSKHTIYLQMGDTSVAHEIRYSFDKENWALWGGEECNYDDFLKGKFKLNGPFYDELAIKFIKRTITQFHEAGLWYFMNISGRKHK